MAPTFHHYAPDAVVGEGTRLRVFLGSLAGSTSPVTTYTPPLLGAEATLAAGATLELDVDPSFEHGILLDSGDLRVNGEPVPQDHLLYQPTGRRSLRLEAGDSPVRALILGGEPLGEHIVMWWNFVARTHDEIVAYRTAWQAEISAEPATASSFSPSPRFGTFPEGQPPPVPAPELPHGRLRPRG
ncbi:pirin family protein [Demequina aurantiaca]|uniref:pirin family protein n=1 Tax=Demequina aurantiaca TaxID=676200 RepID=UPI0034E25604